MKFSRIIIVGQSFSSKSGILLGNISIGYGDIAFCPVGLFYWTTLYNTKPWVYMSDHHWLLYPHHAAYRALALIRSWPVFRAWHFLICGKSVAPLWLLSVMALCDCCASAVTCLQSGNWYSAPSLWLVLHCVRRQWATLLFKFFSCPQMHLFDRVWVSFHKGW